MESRIKISEEFLNHVQRAVPGAHRKHIKEDVVGTIMYFLSAAGAEDEDNQIAMIVIAKLREYYYPPLRQKEAQIEQP